MEYLDILKLFSMAESVYSAMQRNGVLTAEPSSFRIPFQLPHHRAKAFAVVIDGAITEIEIEYESGKTETIRSTMC